MKLDRIRLIYYLSALRNLFIKKMQRIVLGKIRGHIPFNVIRSIPEIMNRAVIKKHIIEYIEVVEPSLENYKFEKRFPDYFRNNKAFDSRNLYLLNDVVVAPKSGAVWLPEGNILLESIGSLNKLQTWSSAKYEMLLPVKALQSERIYFCCPNITYYHYLLETLPNIIYAKQKYPGMKLIFHKEVYSYIIQSCELLFGKEGFKEKFILTDQPLRIKSLIFTGYEPVSGFVPSKDLFQLRSTFLSAPERGAVKSDRRIYISRKSTRRKFNNEMELENELEKIGVEIIMSETLNFCEQIQIFNSANLIIGSHGAGLSNIVWGKNGSKILELFSNNYFNDCYARLAKSVNLEYDYEFCTEDEKGYGKIPIDRVLKKINEYCI